MSKMQVLWSQDDFVKVKQEIESFFYGQGETAINNNLVLVWLEALKDSGFSVDVICEVLKKLRAFPLPYKKNGVSFVIEKIRDFLTEKYSKKKTQEYLEMEREYDPEIAKKMKADIEKLARDLSQKKVLGV